MRATLKPTPAGQRIDLLDCVRGFALIGICIANLVSFAGLYVMTPDQLSALPWPVADRIVLFLVDCFVEGKFYTLFSVLFGIGFGLQAGKAERLSAPFAGFWCRRMAALCLFGLIHLFLIWYGDILTLYSVMGVLLLCFRTLKSHHLLWWIGGLLLMPLAIQTGHFLTSEQPFWQSLAQLQTQLKTHWGFAGRSLFEMRSSNNGLEILASNMVNAVTRPMSYLQSGRPFQVLGQFVLGFWIAREILPRLNEPTFLRARSPWPFALVGLVCSAVYAAIKAYTHSPSSEGALGMVQSLVYHAGSTTLALCYLLLIARLWQAPRWRAMVAWLLPLGRMPLTNYLSQSVIALLLFYGFGLGWMGEFPFAALIPLTMSIILLQRALCQCWLRHWQQGPLERLWRWLAYP
ncbi:MULTISPECIES: DUF418 domain-containing protein [unclassified Janthinobacterium]|uniref:DUF418 domain-containing protein n=1 Tax=unclassified Janthinobacterium TaxID=2610881 RepID=UPI0003455D72|nr:MULTISPECIES: DUF418 domain-containing protein [unclassified Janthinobacterium]MEC5162054.1 uncharacterized protein [Janthinobacterium sp. CG_S6]